LHGRQAASLQVEAGPVPATKNTMSNPLDFDPIIEARRQWAANGWEDACDGMAAITSVVRAQQLFLGRIDTVLRPLELTFARYEVLMLLLFSRRGSLPLNKIGARLQVHPTSVTNAVDRLEEQDLIKRVPHSSDRRTTLAEILPVGRELAMRATRALNEEVFSQPGMNREDLDQLIDVLRRFRQAAGDFSEQVSAGDA
jgi:DNA-binding MarR family transcriptional regulator